VAKVTEEYVRGAFYRRFARMTRWQQDGIIEGLRTIRDTQATIPVLDSGEGQLVVSAIEAADLEGIGDE
jgi:hypothetical protein